MVKIRRAPRRLFSTLRTFALLGALPTAVLAGVLPANPPPSYPGWWFARDVVLPADPSNLEPTWPGDYPAADDYAAMNQGQLKQLATAAYDELQALPGGSGPALDALVKGWFQLDGDGNFVLQNGVRVPLVTANTDSFAAVSLGQLKTVAQPFYDRLIAVASVSAYPWASSANPADDYAMANLGQAKSLFSFTVPPPPVETQSVRLTPPGHHRAIPAHVSPTLHLPPTHGERGVPVRKTAPLASRRGSEEPVKR